MSAKMQSNSSLSKEQCESVLLKYYQNNNFNLLNFKLRPLSDNIEGYLGEHFWLDIEVEYKNEITNLSFFTKFQPATDFMQDFCEHINAFKNELCFYKEIIPEFKKYCKEFDESFIPKFYYANENVIILENCAKLNFRVADSPDILGIDHVTVILKALAKFHSASIIYEERKSKELKKPYKLINDYEDNLKETFFRKDKNYLGYIWHHLSLRTNLGIVDKMPEKYLNREEFKKKYSELAESCCEIAQPSKKFRNVCCHADLWRNNVLFKYENNIPVECKIVDFQLMKYYPPAYDVLKFVYQVMTVDDRHHHLDDLLLFYYQQLFHELKLGGLSPESVLPYDEFQASIKYMLGYVKVEASYYYHYQRTGAEFMNKLAKNEENYRNYMFKDRQILVDEAYVEGSYFKKNMDEILLEINDIIKQDNFSTEDCRTVLKNNLNSTNYNLIHYDIKLLNEQNGFLGRHTNLKTIIKINNEEKIINFFAKFLPETTFTDFAVSSGAFDNEVFMYDSVFKMMNKLGINIYECVPKCYFTRRNDVLVFEELTELGYKPLNKHKALNYDQVRVILSGLAKFHGASFILEEKLTELNKKPFRIIEEFEEKLKEVAYIEKENHAAKEPIASLIKGFQSQIDLFPDPNSKISDQQLKKKVEIIFNKLMFEFSKPSKVYRNVICHGDLWASNILLKYDENGTPLDVKFVDFQTVKKCPPTQDLMAFIYLTTSRKFRTNYMNDILNHYFQELEKYLLKYNYQINNILPYAQFLESCEYYKTFAISQTVTHFQFIMATAKDMAKLFEDKNLCHKTFYEDRSDFIKMMCNENSHYKLVSNESIKDFRIMCENLHI